MSKEKGIIAKVTGDIADHAKTQHEITKARHTASKMSPAQAKEDFKERHGYAKLSPAEKQKIELEKIRQGEKPGQNPGKR